MTRPDPDGEAVVQVVSAVAGFAYGVIGADIHVIGADRTPLYILMNWRSAATVDDAWLRELPSRMLNARFEVVPFTGRAEALDELRGWRDGAGRLSVRWLHGPGGVGKTRLAARFAAETDAADWRVVTAVPGPGSVIPPPGSQDLRLDGAAGLLLIVDYADRWPLGHLTWLFSNALLHQVGVPTRILLLARTSEAWPAVRGVLANHQAGTSSQLLAQLPVEDGHRAEMFEAARDSFAERYRLDRTEDAGPPNFLAGPEMGLTLAVHMAALVAVDARATGRRAPADMAGLSMYLLDREHAHWALLCADPARTIGAGTAYSTPPAVMNRTVFVAGLTGAVPRAAGAVVLRQTQVTDDPEQVLADHAVCYPPATGAADSVLEPLYPDRLAEDFLALTIPGHPADYPAGEWAPATADAVLAHRDGVLARSVTFLAAAADRWPHVGRNYLYPLLHRDPELAVQAGQGALTTLATAREVDLAMLARIDELLPEHQHVNFDVAAATISGRLLPTRVAASGDLAEQADCFGRHAERLSRVGRFDEAVHASEQGLDRFRRLAAADPATFLPRVALTVNNLGTHLAQAGRLTDGLAASQEAVVIRRRLADVDPGRHLPDLATSLHNSAITLDRLGRHDESTGPAEEAVGIFRRAFEEDPDRFALDLANALASLTGKLLHAAREAEALEAARQSTDIYQTLAERNPAAYLPGYAMALNNLGSAYIQHPEHVDAAFSTLRQAITLLRPLVDNNPDAHLPMIASFLHNTGAALTKAGQSQEALAVAEEAVAIRRRLAAANPAAHLNGLANSLQNLSRQLADLDRHQDAVTAGREAVELYRQLVRANPSLSTELADSLAELTLRLERVGQVDEAREATSEAVDLLRATADGAPRYRAALAKNLHRHAAQLATAGEPEQALPSATEALELYRQLAGEDPQTYEEELAEVLHNTGLWTSTAGRPDLAVPLGREAVATYRRLAGTDPEPSRYQSQLAAALGAYSDHLAGTGLVVEALPPVQEAAEIFRSLPAEPEGDPLDLARSLNNLGVRLGDLGRAAEAVTALTDAVTLHRQRAEADPSTGNLFNLAGSLDNLAIRLSETDAADAAVTASAEAVNLLRRLAETDPTTYRAELAQTLSNHGNRLRQAGDAAGSLAAAAEAVALLRPLAAAAPERHLNHLSGALFNLALRARSVGDLDTGVAAGQESVELLRQMADVIPGIGLPRLADALTNLAGMLSELERDAESLAYTEEALEVRWRLADADPEAEFPEIVRLMNLRALRLAELNLWRRARAASRELVELVRRLAAENRSWLRELARALQTYAIIRVEYRRELKLARRAVDEALGIYEELLDQRSDLLDEYLMVCDTLADILEARGDVSGAAHIRAHLAGVTTHGRS
ncbi:tetratricopeptide repeat protein [Micromonosporaceae bacterium B7E4]